MDLNYFDFFNLPVSFVLDEAALKRLFYANSRKYHPDFFTLESEAQQAEALRLSTLNNNAYATLNDPDKRMKYILDLKGVLGEEGEQQLASGFLMEVMALNEQLMELEFDYNEAAFQQVTQLIEAKDSELLTHIQPFLEQYTEDAPNAAEMLEKIKEFYLKQRYLLRIRENLGRFAS